MNDAPPGHLGSLFDHLDQILEKDNYTLSPDGQFILEGTAKVKADWPEIDQTAEIEQEESRRLCWNSVMLASTLREFTPLTFDPSTWNLHFIKPENVGYSAL